MGRTAPKVMMRRFHAAVLALAVLPWGSAPAGEQVLDPRLHHLRTGGEPENDQLLALPVLTS